MPPIAYSPTVSGAYESEVSEALSRSTSATAWCAAPGSGYTNAPSKPTEMRSHDGNGFKLPATILRNVITVLGTHLLFSVPVLVEQDCVVVHPHLFVTLFEALAKSSVEFEGMLIRQDRDAPLTIFDAVVRSANGMDNLRPAHFVYAS